MNFSVNFKYLFFLRLPNLCEEIQAVKEAIHTNLSIDIQHNYTKIILRHITLFTILDSFRLKLQDTCHLRAVGRKLILFRRTKLISLFPIKVLETIRWVFSETLAVKICKIKPLKLSANFLRNLEVRSEWPLALCCLKVEKTWF